MKKFLSRLFFKIFKRQILKAASKERLYKKFTTKERGPNETLPELSIVRARANNLYLNDPFIYGAVNTIINRAIGPGSTLQAQTESEAFNTAIESAFADWARVADYYRQFHFGDIQRICFKKLFLDGGIFIRFVHNPKDPISHFGVELIEYSSLATDLMGTNITSGVETNNDGIVLAYYFRKPNGTILKVNADDVLHFTYERRPGQLLGIPLLVASLPYAYNLADIMEAELVNARVSASFGLLIKRNQPQSFIENIPENEKGERELEIAPGMVEFLEPGEDVAVIDPKRPGNTFDPFVKLILRGIGKPLGLSYEQISGDKSEVNYSSARHSELEFRDFIQSIVVALERYVLTPIYVEFVRRGVLLGSITVQGGIKDWKNWTSHKWVHKGFEWVDPLKEMQAKELELRMGLTSLADEAAKVGKDWMDVVRQRAKEVSVLNSLGLIDVSQQKIDTDTIEAIKASGSIKGGANGSTGQ